MAGIEAAPRQSATFGNGSKISRVVFHGGNRDSNPVRDAHPSKELNRLSPNGWG
jgi:hypothetical protein